MAGLKEKVLNFSKNTAIATPSLGSSLIGVGSRKYSPAPSINDQVSLKFQPVPLSVVDEVEEDQSDALVYPLHAACRRMDVIRVRKCIESAPTTAFGINDQGEMPIHVTIRYVPDEATFEILSVLMKNGTPADSATMKKETPLHYCVRYKKFCAMKTLMASKPDPNVKNSDGLTPLALLFNLQNSDVPLTQSSYTPTQMAVDPLYLEMGPYLVEHGAKLESDIIDLENVKELAKWALSRGSVAALNATVQKMAEFGQPINILGEVTKADFSKRALTEVPEELLQVLRLPNCIMRELDLSNNRIDALPPLLATHGTLEKVNLNMNPLKAIPEKFREGWPKVKKYLETITNTSENWNDRKLLFVGQEGMGKTTLLKCFQKKQNKVACTENLSTDGLAIHKDMHMGGNVTFTAWDLGGQEVFYPTHQFFLTSNSIYIVVFSLVKADMERVDYWMNQIRNMGSRNSRTIIFIVGTSLDKMDDSGKMERATELINNLCVKYPKDRYLGYKGAVAVSCKTGAGIKELKARILEATSDLGQQLIHPAWIQLFNMLKNANEQQTSWSQYEQWAKSCGVQPGQLQLATEFLIDVGAVIHFNDTVSLDLRCEGDKGLNAVEDISLKDLVILKPQWLADVMA